MANIQSADSSVEMNVVAASANSAAIIAYNNDGPRVVSTASKATYAASAEFTPPATPTDMVIITGSATKIIRVVSLYFTSINTAGGVSETLFVIKRNNANFGGTFVAATAVALDSNDAAATATVGHYTANPSTLGQTVGTVNAMRVAVAAATPTAYVAGIEEAGQEMIPWGGSSFMDKLLTLNNQNDSLVMNFNSAALFSGQLHGYRIIWTEE